MSLGFRQLFPRGRSVVIGMIHLRALPGTPRNRKSIGEISEIACKEANMYAESGIDGLIIENMHDIPYLHKYHIGPEVTASMARVCRDVRSMYPTMPLGVQILAGANKEALAVAKATELNFIRAEGFVFSHIADEGLMHACAGELLRYRRTIEAEHISILTDIKKKHSAHSITSDVSIEETAHGAEFFLSDGLILTGSATGQQADVEQLKGVKSKVNLPVLIGSGITKHNVNDYSAADGFIVGSYFKKNGHWNEELDTDRIKRFMDEVCI
ncbi:unnamed protein product [Owenia fusiformis]|uniref:Uncharacterized protein n=1 Tax=Owenia fusiformis TaxID=6347 RepID=A0A8J1TTF9_OWEFU|nr:unnamed protein product [Owenia fusiformis]